MALRNEDILRLKFELGYNVTGIGAEVYVQDGYIAVFDRAVQPYLIDVGTTSVSPVTSNLVPTITAITLAANPASITATQSLSFVPGSNVVIDLGPLQETSVILSLTGLVATLQLSLAHGTSGAQYPVVLFGAEQFIRDVFARLDAIKSEMLNVAPKTAGIAQVDEIKVYGATRGRTGQRNKIDDLLYQRDEARRDLASLVGVPYLRDVRRRGGGGTLEIY
jgi:hypothetical protein